MIVDALVAVAAVVVVAVVVVCGCCVPWWWGEVRTLLLVFDKARMECRVP